MSEQKATSNKKSIKWMEILFLALLVGQTIVILYFNIKLLANHMGFDSSWTYLKAALIWKEKSINSSNWIDQTNIFLDSSMILASLLFAVTGKIFFSYGLANFILVMLILTMMWRILSMLDFGKTTKFISLNMIICPYLTNGYEIDNDLGYFSNLLSGPAFYGLRALLVLFIVHEFINIRQKNQYSYLIFLIFPLCILAGSSSGIFMLVVILLPFIVYEAEMVLIKNDLKILLSKDCIFAILSCFCVIIGKMISKYLLNINAIDTSRSWTTLEGLWKNFGAVFQGLMKLIGVLPINEEIPIMSLNGIYRIFPLIIFGVIALSIIMIIKKICKDILYMQGVLLFVFNILFVNFVLFGLFNVQYGKPIFEERYLIPAFLMIIILVAFFIGEIDKTKLYGKVIILAMFISLLGNNIVSDKIYICTTNDSWQMKEIVDTVNLENAELIYVYGDDLRTIGRALRAYDLNHVYKAIGDDNKFKHWGDYLYYENNEEYQGKTILILSHNSDIPENILTQYKKIKELDYASIYVCDYNPIDFKAGITGQNSIDYPCTPGILVQNGRFEGNSFISDGTEGYVMWGPYCKTSKGVYDIILYYQIINEVYEGTFFEVALDNGSCEMGRIELDDKESVAIIEDLEFENGHELEYRVNCRDKTKIRIDKIEIIKK